MTPSLSPLPRPDVSKRRSKSDGSASISDPNQGVGFLRPEVEGDGTPLLPYNHEYSHNISRPPTPRIEFSSVSSPHSPKQGQKKRMVKCQSMDSRRFLLKMFFPLSFGSRKCTTVQPHPWTVSPRSSFDAGPAPHTIANETRCVISNSATFRGCWSMFHSPTSVLNV